MDMSAAPIVMTMSSSTSVKPARRERIQGRVVARFIAFTGKSASPLIGTRSEGLYEIYAVAISLWDIM